jgi:putative DNA primase/helicase
MTLEQTDEVPAWVSGSVGPNPREIVAVGNGLIHLPLYAARQPGAIITNTPDFLSFNAVDFTVDRDAPQPVEWVKWLNSLWPGDPDSVALLQEWFGYLLTPDTRQQKMLLLIGPPRCGKGTILNMIQAMLGEDNCAAPSLGSLGGEFGLQPVIGKLAAVIGDARLTHKADKGIITERLLSVSGNDRIDVNRKNQSHFTARLYARFVVATNELPDLPDASGALANRWCILRLKESFLNREDLGLLPRLMNELPGIFNWAVEGWQRLRDNGRFTVPAASREEAEQLADLGSPVSEFLRDRCDVGPDYASPIADVYGEWRRWCESIGRKEVGTQTHFSRQLRAANAQIDRKQRRVGGAQVWHFAGVRLRPEDAASDTLAWERLPASDRIGRDEPEVSPLNVVTSPLSVSNVVTPSIDYL